MAVKTEVYIHKMLPAPEGYDIILTITDGSNAVLEHEALLNLQFGDDAAAWNAAIITYAKEYAETNWSVEFGILDRVRLLNSIDGLLGI